MGESEEDAYLRRLAASVESVLINDTAAASANAMNSTMFDDGDDLEFKINRAKCSLWKLDACDAVEALRRGILSSEELILSSFARICLTNDAINSVVETCLPRALKQAKTVRERVETLRKNGETPPNNFLYGLPILVKDVFAISGVPLTKGGSPLYKDNVPKKSDLMVRILEENGAVVLGVTNAPELSAGANTFNRLHGPTLNPFDARLTVGGSSGGSAAALATGQAYLAAGSDLGGSLRIPASFCGVVGMRMSPGWVPTGMGEDDAAIGSASPEEESFIGVHVINGPMARSVRDLAMFMDAMCISKSLKCNDSKRKGWNFDTPPLSLDKTSTPFATAVRIALKAGISAASPDSNGVRVAWSSDLDGLCKGCLNKEVVNVCRKSVERFCESTGSQLTDACPKLTVSISSDLKTAKTIPKSAFMSRHQVMSALTEAARRGKTSHNNKFADHGIESPIWDARTVFHVIRGRMLADMVGYVACTAIRMHNEGYLWPLLLFSFFSLVIEIVVCAAGIPLPFSLHAGVYIAFTLACLALQGLIIAFVSLLPTELRWNIQIGVETSAQSAANARLALEAIMDNVRDFFTRKDAPYHVIITPTVMVPPFDVRKRYVASTSPGNHFENYVRWLEMTSIVSVLSCPCISVPCGTTRDGLPVGVQIIGQPFSDEFVIAVAAAFESSMRESSDELQKPLAVPVDPVGVVAGKPWPRSERGISGPETSLGSETHHAVGRAHENFFAVSFFRSLVLAGLRIARK